MLVVAGFVIGYLSGGVLIHSLDTTSHMLHHINSASLTEEVTPKQPEEVANDNLGGCHVYPGQRVTLCLDNNHDSFCDDDGGRCLGSKNYSSCYKFGRYTTTVICR
ncbi:MAG: hypothetical protein A2301_02190 [Candidatus Magasanikbacteria bacterium RIFOXYB2_FULL_40_13]|uniref:Uncharacterized protein n=1 Tax=Candidatus Magasanikbacteria bacterium RIFOXYB1_FULL_40_15 TaxID=1798697 RepID=A0A1F6NDQ3_9BACT|nr:MAG: hypothetical protein A2373_04445 [Candidatus Magasanikbacteria bacterium RIFOXYB1_FULL_40_15]OGH86837.1 MAG: hypothetical protein A2301_02190 [Candidatus Magasanikbacteria bacterium RIFOXYB2_FULL_40_13]